MKKYILFILLLSISFLSCSKDDNSSNSVLTGKWDSYQLDDITYIAGEPILGCPGKITGKSDAEKWSSFMTNYIGKHEVSGCEIEKSIDFKSDGTCWVDGTKYGNYKMSSDKKSITFTGIDADGSKYEEEVDVEGVEGTVMMTTNSPVVSTAIGPTNSFTENTFYTKR